MTLDNTVIEEIKNSFGELRLCMPKPITIKIPATNSRTDCLVRIKNGYMMRKETVNVVSTKVIKNILNALKDTGYIMGFTEEKDSKNKDYIKVILNYASKKGAIRSLRIFSCPSQRMFIKKSEIKEFHRKFCQEGYGTAFISSSQYGIIPGYTAEEKKTGGELLFTLF